MSEVNGIRLATCHVKSYPQPLHSLSRPLRLQSKIDTWRVISLDLNVFVLLTPSIAFYYPERFGGWYEQEPGDQSTDITFSMAVKRNKKSFGTLLDTLPLVTRAITVQHMASSSLAVAPLARMLGHP